MVPFAVTVRYRYSEGDRESRTSSFHGRFYNRSEAAVLDRLREVHRFASRIDVAEVRWDDAGAAASRGAAALAQAPAHAGQLGRDGC